MRDVHPGMKIQFPMHPNGVLPPSQKKTNPGYVSGHASCPNT